MAQDFLWQCANLLVLKRDFSALVNNILVISFVFSGTRSGL